jgi:hypothetical protein
MAFRPSQYEHVPDSSEEPFDAYAGQSAFNDEGQLACQLRTQPYDSVAHSDAPVSYISIEDIPQDHQPIQVLQHSENDPTVKQQPPSSQSIHDSDTSRPKPAIFTSTRGKQREGSWVDALSDWWWWELGSVFLSCACFIAIIITLRIMQDKPLSSWHSIVSPNAVISTLATISKSSLMLAVAACISQLKWHYFQSVPHSLQNIQVFDDASRGPLGALELVTRLSPREVFSRQSGGAGWTFWASILTILALALDPFAQQILSFPLRTVPSLTDPLAASISVSQVYDTGNAGGISSPSIKTIDMALQGAVQNGLYTLNSPVEFSCTTANCTWPPFYTLGICSSCANVTDQTNTTCTPGKRVRSCNYTLPSGLRLSNSHYYNTSRAYEPTVDATARTGEFDLNSITAWLVNAGIVRFYKETPGWPRTESFECGLSWCAKRYSAVNVTAGNISTPDIRSYPLRSPKAYFNEESLNSFVVSDDDDIDFNGPDRIFIVNANNHKELSTWLADTFFNTSDKEAVARALYMQSNISQIFENIANSMTNKIREGPNATKIYGTSYREETYIHVTWAWLILPGVVVFMAVVLLAASIVSSRGLNGGLWKNSALALLFTQIRGCEHEGLKVGRWSEIENQAKGLRGKLRSNSLGGLDFIRT